MLTTDYGKIAGINYKTIMQNGHNDIFGERKIKIMNAAPNELVGLENCLEYVNLLLKREKNLEEIEMYIKEKIYLENKISDKLIDMERKLLLEGKKFVKMEEQMKSWDKEKKRIISKSLDKLSGLKNYLEALNFDKKMLCFVYPAHINHILDREIKNVEVEISNIVTGSTNNKDKEYEYLKIFGYLK